MQSWYEIKNEADRSDIYIFDEIGFFGISAATLVNEIKTIGNKPLGVHLNSGGGAVFDGFAIHEVLRAHPAPVTVYVEGLAASIASVIAMAGDEIQMSENSLMMIHNAQAGVGGNKEELIKMADVLKKIDEQLLNIYHKKSKRKRDKIAQMMENETWLNAEEAVEMGFADKKTKAIKLAANLDTNKFKVPSDKLKYLNMASTPTLFERFKNWLSELKDEVPAELKAKFTEFQASLKKVEDDLIAAQASLLTKTNEIAAQKLILDNLTSELEAGDQSKVMEKITAIKAETLRLKSEALLKDVKITAQETKITELEQKVLGKGLPGEGGAGAGSGEGETDKSKSDLEILNEHWKKQQFVQQ